MRRRKDIFQYYVEGEDDKCIVNTLKSEMFCIQSGKVNVFNVVQEKFNLARIRTLKDNTIVVLIYDTDINNIQILQDNIDFLRKQKAVKEIICIPQVNNLEDELVRACSKINAVEQITRSSTKKDYKRDLIKCNNLGQRLQASGFDLNKMWKMIPTNGFKEFGNESSKICIK